MIRCIGLLEVTSIARGVECADSMLKTADVELVMANPVCPGKYVVIISGDVDAINASIDTGKEIAGEFLVGEFVLASIHEDLIAAMNRAVSSEPNKAVGVVECFSIAAALEGADAAAKAADVILFDIRPGVGIGGKSYFVVLGDVSAVNAAVDAGLNIVVNKYGSLITSVVIPNPRQEVIDML
jgi:microcompartment protein CcmL/EutN